MAYFLFLHIEMISSKQIDSILQMETAMSSGVDKQGA